MSVAAPFVWFGGKRKVAAEVWSRFGDVANYVEPFFGSGAVLLGRPPGWSGNETINDADGMVANFWRATKAAPDEVAAHADHPVFECLPAGTMISTPAGPVPIESVRPGMVVYGERDGLLVEARVLGIKQGEAAELHAVGAVRMTGNHPVWTREAGYIEARRLAPGMHVGFLDIAVGKIDLAVLLSKHERSGVGNLLVGRSSHHGGAVCRDHVPREGAIPGAPVAGDPRWQDASGLLDSVADRGGNPSSLHDAGTRHRGRLAGAGAVLDLGARFNADQSHGGRRRDARLCSDAGVAGEVVRDAIGRPVCVRSQVGHVGAQTFPGSDRKDPTCERGSQDAGFDASGGIGSAEGEGSITGAPREAVQGAPWQAADGRASAEDWRRSPRQLQLQRETLSAPVAVYNFQTETGNYFAGGLLVHNCDLHARHVWLVKQLETVRAKLEGDPEWFDAKIAGWWVWGVNCWIGSGFCSGRGPWWTDESGKLVHLGDNGQGVKRQLVHLGNFSGNGTNARGSDLIPWFRALAARLRRVRVCSGDWSRVCGPSVTFKHGMTAVFLDPPYADTADRTGDLYRVDSDDVAHAVREWAIENGDNQLLRIALCGYAGEHEMPGTWAVQEWSAGEGFGAQADERSGNGKRERIWYSPACLSTRQRGLFDVVHP